MTSGPEHRALLELILRHGQTYGGIAAVIGIPPAEARARAHDALADLAGRDLEARADLGDFLLGQLEPPACDRVIEALRSDRPAHELAVDLSARLRELEPHAELPELPGEPASAPRRRLRSDPRSRRLLAAGAVAAGAGLIAILAVSGDQGDGDAPASTATTATTTATGAGEPAPVVLELAATRVAPEGAVGGAAIARTADGVVLEYRATGLEATAGSERYVVWLFNGPDAAVPLTAGRRVGPDGRLTGLASVPPALVEALPRTRFVDISLEPRPQRRGSPAYRGQSILRGALAEVSVSGAARRP